MGFIGTTQDSVAYNKYVSEHLGGSEARQVTHLLTKTQADTVYRAILDASNLGGMDLRMSFPHKDIGMVTVDWFDVSSANRKYQYWLELPTITVTMRSAHDYMRNLTQHSAGDLVCKEGFDALDQFVSTYSLD